MRFDLIKQDVSGSPSSEKPQTTTTEAVVAQCCEKLSIDKEGKKHQQLYARQAGRKCIGSSTSVAVIYRLGLQMELHWSHFLKRGGFQIKIKKLVQVLMDYNQHYYYSFPFNEA